MIFRDNQRVGKARGKEIESFENVLTEKKQIKVCYSHG